MDNYDTIIAGYMHPSIKQLISYDTNTNTGILYTSAWKPIGVFKVVKGRDVFQKSFENYVNTTRCMNAVTLKNVIDYANANFERSVLANAMVHTNILRNRSYYELLLLQ